MAQLYPPDNGQGPARFKRWYVDEVTGAMMPEDRTTRDFHERLRHADDVDKLGRDELTLFHEPPMEPIEEELE